MMTPPESSRSPDPLASWLEELPRSWEKVRLRRLFSVETGATPSTKKEENWGGDIPWVTPDDLRRCETGRISSGRRSISRAGLRASSASLFPPGSLILSARGSVGQVALAEEQLCANQSCYGLVPLQKDVDSRYYLYALTICRPILEAASHGATFDAITSDELGEFWLPVPPQPVQVAIADYLSEVTAAIRLLADRRRDLLQLLQDRLYSRRHRLVTSGLNSSPLRRTSIEWLKWAPEHWGEASLSVLSKSIQTGPFGAQLHASDYVGDGVPVVNPANLSSGSIVPDWEKTVTDSDLQRLHRYVLRKGDVVIARRGEMGRVALVGKDEDGWLCGTGSLRIRPGSRVTSRFLYVYLSQPLVAEWLSLQSVGSTMDNLSTDILGELPVLVPPITEQEGIADELAADTKATATVRKNVQRQVMSLQGYREALVESAVTGKIDVRAPTSAVA